MKALLIAFFLVSVAMIVLLVYLAFTSELGVVAGVLAFVWAVALLLIARVTARVFTESP